LELKIDNETVFVGGPIKFRDPGWGTPRPALSNNERKYFFARGPQGESVNVIVHPINCQPRKTWDEP